MLITESEKSRACFVKKDFVGVAEYDFWANGELEFCGNSEG